jgi:hypothetical protein
VLAAAARTGMTPRRSRRCSITARTGPRTIAGETALMWARARTIPVRLLIASGAPVDGRSEAAEYAKDRFGLEAC